MTYARFRILAETLMVTAYQLHILRFLEPKQGQILDLVIYCGVSVNGLVDFFSTQRAKIAFFRAVLQLLDTKRKKISRLFANFRKCLIECFANYFFSIVLTLSVSISDTLTAVLWFPFFCFDVVIHELFEVKFNRCII